MGGMTSKMLVLLLLTCLQGIARTGPSPFPFNKTVNSAGGQAAAQQTAPRINGGLPSVSPDGLNIAFVSNRGGSNDLFIIGADGTGELQLTHTPEEEGNLAWTSGGRILFSVFAGDTSRLFTIDRDGRNQRQVAGVPGRGPALSPDGQRLLYMSGTWTATRLMVSGADGSNAKQITDGSSIAWNNHLVAR